MQRTLSGVERMMCLLSEQTSANGFVSVRIRGRLDEERLRVALDRLPRRHPLLSTRVVREQGVLVFTTEAMPPIPLRIISDDGSGQSFLEVGARELVAPLPRSTGPLTRFTLVRHADGEQADLLITVDHTIADGTACLYAIRDLLELHESPDLEIDPVALPPPVTYLSPAPAPVLDAASAPVPLPSAGIPPPPWPFASTSDVVIATAELPRETMRALARRCRERGVTVHAAVCAAFAAACAALSEGKTEVIISSPVSYRHRLDPGVRDTVSCSVAFADLHVNVSQPGSFWEQAHAVRQQLLEWTTDQKIFGSAFAIEAASQAERDDARFLHRVSQDVKRHDLSITNIGRQPIPTRHGGLTIEAVHGAACLPGEIVVALGAFDETMYVTLSTSGLSSAENDAARRMLASALARLRMLPA
jgi:hypothetical protein